MTDKYTHLSRGMDKVINDANTEIQALQGRIGSMLKTLCKLLLPALTNRSATGAELKNAQQKNVELIELYKEKNRKHQQTQHLYDALKKKVMMGQVHTAASENANHTLQSINASTRPGTHSGISNMNLQAPLGNHHRRSQVALFENEQLHPHQRSGSASQNGSEVGLRAPLQHSQRSRRWPSISSKYVLILRQRTSRLPRQCIVFHMDKPMGLHEPIQIDPRFQSLFNIPAIIT